MKSFYPSFGGAWSAAVSYIAGAAHYCQDHISWPALKSAFDQVTSSCALDPLAASSAAHDAGMDKSAVATVTEMATAAGAKLLDFNHGLKSAYGALYGKADDCMHEMGEFLHDLGGWLRGDDPYPQHFGASHAMDEPPADASMADVSLTGVWAWATGTSTAEPDY